MTGQHEMFEHAYDGLRAIRRNLDPQPSHEAAAHLHTTGKLTEQCLATLAALARHGDGCTSYELAGDDLRLRYQHARRLPDLAHMGFVEKRPARACRVTWRRATTWAVTDAGRAVLREGRAA